MKQRLAPLLCATLILLLAWGLILVTSQHVGRFHPDEALYMTASRAAAVQGDWLLVTVPQDKPPLTMYLNALSVMLVGTHSDDAGVLHLDVHRGEFAGRLVSMASALLLVAVVMAIAKRLSHSVYTMLAAGLLVALSPMLLAFAPTAFTDMPMVLFGMLGVLYALRGKSTSAGAWAFLAFASKPQGIFYLTLVIVLLWHTQKRLPIRVMLPFAVGIVALWAWDAARVSQGAIDVWTLGQAHYTTPEIASADAWGSRLSIWLDYGRALYGSLLTLLLIGFGVWGVFRQKNAVLWWLMLWSVTYGLVHVVSTVPLYDRYLLPLVPMLAILAVTSVTRARHALPLQYATLETVGAQYIAPNPSPKSPPPTERGLDVSSQISNKGILPPQGGRNEDGGQIAGFRGGIMLIIALLLILPETTRALNNQLHVGGDLGQHDGIDQLADYINDKPVATVIYDHWLGWELGYYLSEWTNKRRVYYPTPKALVKDALLLDEVGMRYFVAPVDEDISEWLAALKDAGFNPQEDARIGNFVVVALTPVGRQAD